MNPETGEILAIQHDKPVPEGLVEIPEQFVAAFKEQRRKLKDRPERVAALKAARRKANKLKKASRRKNR